MLIKKSSLILHETPFAIVLSNPCRALYCATCLKRTKLQFCQGCTLYFYCSKYCQKSDWTIHKAECVSIQKLQKNYINSIPSTVLMLLRVIYKLEKNNQDGVKTLFAHSCIEGSPSRKFSDLMSHKDQIFNDPINAERFDFFKQALGKLISPKLFAKYQENLVDIYGKICINSICILNHHFEAIAMALYMNLSSFNHKCVPNANVIFNGPNVLVSLTEDVTLEDGEPFYNKIYINYIDPLETFQNRQMQLKERYFFDCECALCHRHSSLAEYNCSFLPASLAFSPKDVNALTNGEQAEMVTKIERFLAKLDKAYEEYCGDNIGDMKQSDPLPPNLYPSTTNVYYNQRLIKIAEEKANSQKSQRLQIYHINLALFAGNAFKEYFPESSIMHVYHVFILAQYASHLNDMAQAVYFMNLCKDLYQSAFSPEVIAQVKRFPQYQSVLTEFIQTDYFNA